jgi:hypothetical protein
MGWREGGLKCSRQAPDQIFLADGDIRVVGAEGIEVHRQVRDVGSARVTGLRA